MADVTCDILKIFDEKTTRRGKTRIQVIRWGNYPPVLEKRDYWYDAEDNEKTGKLRGMNSEDLGIVADNLNEIEKMLNKMTVEKNGSKR